ncbi:carbohydrate ABC transporter permease, partial [Streptomyces roseolus]
MSVATKTPAAQAVPWTKRLSSVRLYLGVLIILVWGLGPFYWMAVTAFRDPDYTFDNTPWPTHVTLENFRNAFDTSRGNDFGRALIN